MSRKYNKSETTQWAKEQGFIVGKAVTMDVREREKLSYQDRETMAQEACVAFKGRLSGGIFAFSNYPDAFDYEFKQAWHRAFYRPIEELNGKRKAWRNLITSGITHEAAMKIVADYIKSTNIRGARYDSSYARTLEVRRGWDVQASLYMEFERSDRDYMGISNPDNDQERAGTYDFEVKVSWSGTSRTVEIGLANIALYRELLELAAEIKSMMREYKVIWTWGIAKPEPETPPANTETGQEVPNPAAS